MLSPTVSLLDPIAIEFDPFANAAGPIAIAEVFVLVLAVEPIAIELGHRTSVVKPIATLAKPEAFAFLPNDTARVLPIFAPSPNDSELANP